MSRLATAALTTVVLLAGCAGVPLKTMWKLRSFGVDDFAAVDPADVRAAIQLEDDLVVKPGATALKVALHGTDGSAREFSVPLHTVRQGRNVGDSLPPAKSGRHWYLFDLTEEGVEDFKALQRELQAPREQGSISIEVASAFENPPDADRGKLPMEIRLQLDAEDGFFVLFDGKVDLAKQARSSD